MNRVILITCFSITSLLAGCGEAGSGPDPELPPAPPGVVASDPGAFATTLPNIGALAASNVAYLSAEPGTFPEALVVTARNITRSSPEKSSSIMNGGFDPFVIDAEAGDLISLNVSALTDENTVSIRVPPRKPPRVVRTNPGRGRTDVALNVQVIVVFSEPVERQSVTSSSLSLQRADGITVKGQIAVSDDGLSAEFIPDEPLAGLTEYSLNITQDVKDQDGDVLEALTTVAFVTVPASPSLSGTLAFVSSSEGKQHIYLSNPDGTEIRRLTNSDEAEFLPQWSPDGQQLVFNRHDGTFVIRRDGSGLIRLPGGGNTPSWLPDGKRLLVSTQTGLRIVSADGSGTNDANISLQPATGGFGASPDFAPWGAKWSPDGGRIVFAAWTTWDFIRAFVINLDGSGGRTFINPLNGFIWDECAPEWSPDGKRLAVLGGIFGSQIWMRAEFGIGIIDPEVGNVTTINVPGTTCWDGNDDAPTVNGMAWSPDGLALAITQRTPPWVQGQPAPTNQKPSIAIVDTRTKFVLKTIPDAYDPTWTAAR